MPAAQAPPVRRSNSTPGLLWHARDAVTQFTNGTMNAAATDASRRNRTILLLGVANSGKTVFATQSLVAAAQAGEPGILVSFDESPETIRRNAAEFGWNVPALETRGLLLLHARVRPHLARAGQFAIEAILSALAPEVSALGVRHVVFDGLHVMLALLEDQADRLQTAARIRTWVTEHRLTATMTCCVGIPGTDGFVSPDLIETIAECVIGLELETHPGGCAVRRLRLLKYRGAHVSDIVFPVQITGSGMDLLPLPTTTPEGPGAALHASSPDLTLARHRLTHGICRAHHFLEAKQAELDFLLLQHQPPLSPDCRNL